jgi:hypothetical protein
MGKALHGRRHRHGHEMRYGEHAAPPPLTSATLTSRNSAMMLSRKPSLVTLSAYAGRKCTQSRKTLVKPCPWKRLSRSMVKLGVVKSQSRWSSDTIEPRCSLLTEHTRTPSCRVLRDWRRCWSRVRTLLRPVSTASWHMPKHRRAPVCTEGKGRFQKRVGCESV